MNGHSSAETLAFAMLKLGRGGRRPVRRERASPIFIFAASAGSAPFASPRCTAGGAVKGAAIDAPLLDALAGQLVRSTDDRSRQEVIGQADSAAHVQHPNLALVADAQASFIEALAGADTSDTRRSIWGSVFTSLTADYALYLKIVFPDAKFVFMLRHPLDAFRTALRSCGPREFVEHRDASWAPRFAEKWCSLVASFELWHEQADGIIVGYESAMAVTPGMLTAYLGSPLSSIFHDLPAEDEAFAVPELRDDEMIVIAQRTGAIAARYGYTFDAGATSPENGSMNAPAMPPVPAVHTESVSISCAVLVPTIRYIEPECDEALEELQRRGYSVIRMRGCPSIDQGRNRLATLAIEQGFQETLWVDADTGFDPNAVEQLRSYRMPVVAGLCARKSPRGGLAVAPMPGTREVVLGQGGGLVEVLYVGTGFTLVQRDVYVVIQKRFSLPLCDEHRLNRAVPFFMPMLEDWGGSMAYLGEDYAFSRRARLCGYKIMADTSIRLWHIGPYRYGYEDASNAVERMPSYTHVFESEERRGG